MIVESQTERDGQIPVMVQESNNTIDRIRLAKIVRQRLDSLRSCGLTSLPKPSGNYPLEWPNEQVAEPTSAPSSPPLLPENEPSNETETVPLSKPKQDSANAPPTRKAPVSLASNPYGQIIPHDERPSQLSVLQSEVASCTRCPELTRCRTQTVFGVGNPSTRLVFLGEGPGADEDRQGEPFVGAAGQLLDRIIHACKLDRKDVYILNTVKCRPPQNRNPTDSELENCWGYAERQLEILQPEFICCLGSVASRKLLETKQSIGRMRQQFFDYRGSKVVVTYHPAYLLRTPSAKKHVWADMKLLMNAMGHEI